MSTHRRTARVVGVALYIVATVAGVASMVLTRPVVDAAGYLATASLHKTGWRPERCVCSPWPWRWWGSRWPSTPC